MLLLLLSLLLCVAGVVSLLLVVVAVAVVVVVVVRDGVGVRAVVLVGWQVILFDVDDQKLTPWSRAWCVQLASLQLASYPCL